ncbi:hypothetical protein AZE42_13415 [Rhizopogon vesiculosus]|nr:hypothetical protein AZE42_13415 [Rhizopogon vesiculosus]
MAQDAARERFGS